MNKSITLLLGLVVVVGLVLRVISLDQSLWLDEAISVKAAGGFSFSGILTRFSPGDFHPPLHYILLKGWIALVGSNEIAVRSLSVLFGAATIFLVFAIGRRLFSGKVGLVSALFLATAPLHIYYSQEARMYVQASFFAVLAVWFFVRVLQNEKVSWIDWVGLVVASVLLMYTDYLPFFLLVAFGFYLLFFARRHFFSHIRGWIFVAVSVGLLFTPWLPVLSQQLWLGIGVEANAPGWWQVLGGSNLKQFVLVPIKFMIGRLDVDSGLKYVLYLTVPSFLFGLPLFNSVKVWSRTKILWVWLVVPVVLVALLGLWLNVFYYFRLLFVLPAFYLLAAFGGFLISNKSVRVFFLVGVALVNLVSSGVYLFNPRFHREDWRSAVSWVEDESSDSSAVSIFVTDNQRDAYNYYSRGEVLAYGPSGLDGGDYVKIWLMRYVQPIFDAEDAVRGRVEGLGYTKVDERDFNGVVVWEYVR